MSKQKAYFRFYEELNDFLPLERHKRTFPYTLLYHIKVKDAIEAIGVPHTEVELVLVNGESVGFEYPLVDGDRVSVYPMFESIDVSPIVMVREKPLRRTAFVADVHLGKLARNLRMLGFDTLYQNDYEGGDIVDLSVREKRIILTRGRRLLFTKAVTHGYWVRATEAEEQTVEALHRFDLYSQINPFTRCLECNGKLASVDKGQIELQLKPLTVKHFDEFWRCADCGKIYWKGTHWERMMETIKRLVERLKGGGGEKEI